MKKVASLLLALLFALACAACAVVPQPANTPDKPDLLLTEERAEPSETSNASSDGAVLPDEATPPDEAAPAALDEDGSYTARDDVALYLHLYGRLPDNFITKKEASALGWSGGPLEPYAPGMCIGGDRFGNYEGLLPSAPGRTWKECDIDTLGASGRGAKRIVFSDDGLIYYTEDHYKTFVLLYGEELP